MADIDNEMEPSPPMILLMGVTGSGKSFFINRLKEGSTREEHGINAGTSECQLVTVEMNKGSSVALIDTPGFDDNTYSDSEILEKIAEFLAIQFKLGLRLKGIIYLHRITDIRMSGSAIRYLQVFQELVGEHAMPNVILATTMWSKLANEGEGLTRERLLREQYWSSMETKGSYVESYDGSHEMAQEIVIQLSCLDTDVILKLQHEICVQRRRLDQTSAGSLLVPEVEKDLRDCDDELRHVDRRLADAVRMSDRQNQYRLETTKKDLEIKKMRKARGRDSLKNDVDRKAEEKIADEKTKRRIKFGKRDALSVLMAVVGITVNIIISIV